MPRSSYGCDDRRYSYFTRNIFNRCVDNHEILFGASSVLRLLRLYGMNAGLKGVCQRLPWGTKGIVYVISTNEVPLINFETSIQHWIG